MAESTESKALWGGRFESGPSAALEALSRSVQFDWRLAPFDLMQTLAHARVLVASGLLSREEFQVIAAAIEELGADIANGTVAPQPSDEDVHTAIEQELLRRLGPIGGKLRAGRSRNDQIATDLRLYVRYVGRAIASELVALQRALVGQAERHVSTPAPGFTHLQRAQPVAFGHELAKHAHSLSRDLDRLRDWDARTAVSPLGSGALAGSGLPLNPEEVASSLGFTSASANSIDAVSDRDFVAEFLFVTAMVGIHLSRLGEEICLWASQEFGWAALDDAWSTGSSIMPQKKNPDIAELARGKSGRLIGDLTGFLATLKALPFAYNRDLQEDKEPTFDAVDTLMLVLPAMTGLVSTLRFDPARMASSAAGGHALATEIADWLVRQGVPFNEAHKVSGACVRRAESLGVELWELADQDLIAVSDRLTPEVRTALSVDSALASRTSPGGTSPDSVTAQLALLLDVITANDQWAHEMPFEVPPWPLILTG